MRLARPEQRPGQRNRGWIARLRELLDRWTARIFQAEQLGGLVERLARCIVDGGREAPVIADPAHLEQLAVTARDE